MADAAAPPAEHPATAHVAPAATAGEATAGGEAVKATETPTETKPADGEEKKKDPEAAAKKRAERLEKLKAGRLARKEAAKAAREAGEPPKPRAKRAAAAPAEGQPAEPAPKLAVLNLPAEAKSSDLKTLFEPHGAILRAEVSNRKDKEHPLGTVLFLTHAEAKAAIAALHGKHKFEGAEEPITVEYSNDSQRLGGTVKSATESVGNVLKAQGYTTGVLRSRDAKDLINRLVLSRRSTPAAELLTAALLVHTKTATAEELVVSGLIRSAGGVQELLKDVPAPVKVARVAKETRAPKAVAEAKSTTKLPFTFDAVVPLLDKLEKDRWNRMAKANLHLNERHRFRFVDILATPGLELWRWMVEDCAITPAEAGTCFSILQHHYGFAK